MLIRFLALLVLAVSPAGAATVVSLSFDDTYQEHVLARQILDARGLKGTFYVNSPRIGSVSSLYMTRAEVDSLAAAGHEIGGHTLNHLDLAAQTSTETQRQICEDRQNLIAMGYTPTTFAYPFGSYDADVEAAVSGCGYAGARTVGGLGCANCPDAEPLPPPDALAVRTPGSVRADTTLAQMQQSVIDAEQSGGGWVPFVFHRICVGCGDYSVSSANLAAFADWLQGRAAQGTVVRTVGQALGQPSPVFQQAAGVCQTSSGAWRNEPFAATSAPFTAEWDAVPHTAGGDFVMGLSSGAVTGFTQLAALARFYTNGFIQARNGSVYTSVAPIPYTPGLSYHFRLDVDPSAHDYSAYVSSPGGPPRLLASSYAFRTEQSATSVLNNLGFIADVGSGTLCDLLVTPAAPALDVSSPTVALSSPSAGSVLRGTVTVAAAASDDVAVASVQFRLDGAPFGPPDAAAPYSFAWNTALSADGPHSLAAVAWDASGNASTSAAVAVTVDNAPPSISSVAAFVLGPSSASVTWLTGEPATSQVEYGTSAAYGSLTALDPSTVTGHTQLLTGLSAGTSYHYRVRSADAAGNLAVSGDFSFVTAPQPPSACIVSSGAWRNLAFPAQGGPFTAEWDAVPHTPGGDVVMGLSNGAVAGFAQLAAITRFYSNGLVQARNGSAYTAVSSIPYAAGVSYHFRFAVLPASHTYSAFVSSPGGPARTIASDYAFRTEQAALSVLGNLGFIADVGSGTLCNLSVAPDQTPPAVALSSPAAGAVVAGNASVSASASDDIAVSRVQFKLDGAALGPPDASPPYAVVWNTALSSEGPHSLTAVAWDTADNASTSAPVSVVVDNSPLLISSVTAFVHGMSSASVSWLTSEPANSLVEYGTTTAYGSATAPDMSTVTLHGQLLSGLAAGTLYHFRVRSTDTAGDFAASGDFTFLTGAAPDVSSPTVFLSSPSAGAVLRGTVTVAAAASDDLAVAAVQFRLDGAALGPPDSSAPYAFDWDTTFSTDGPHGLDAVAWDAAGNASTSAAIAVTVDNTPPLISSVSLADVGASSAVITWLTDEPATSQVEYGTSTSYGSLTALDPSTATGHARSLIGLSSGTLYHYRARSADVAGNIAVSGDFTFDTLVVPDTTPPAVALSSPLAGAVLRATVTVAATASDDVVVATVQFRLDGADLGPPDSAAPYAFDWDTTFSTDGPHSLDAVAWDAAGNASTSAAIAVTVDNTPPLISSVSLADVGASSAVITWLTDEPATSQVEYGTSTSYGSLTALDPSTATGHARSLIGLSPGTTYHYRARSADVAGNLAVSGGFTLTTSSPPPVSCFNSAGAWVNQPISPQVSSFTVSFDVTPAAAGMNGSVGLASGTASVLAGLAAELRFNPQGFIDARYSSDYAAMTPVPYSAGTAYRFDLRVHAAAHLYDAYVSTPGGARRQIARNYTFRSEQSGVASLSNLGLLAASGGLTVCNPVVSASTVPWWDGVRELYATAVGSKTWYSAWDNRLDRSFGRAVDPVDPWFDAAHGTAQYSVDAASGVFKISGSTPRMYIHHPEFRQGSTSSTVAGSHGKQWHDVEVTVYGMRVSDSNIAWGGIDGIARSNHGITGNETVHLCDSRGIGARFRYNGRLDFEKETRHPTSFAVNTTTTTLWPSGTSMPFNVWIGFKYVVYDLPNGNVKVESYMDMADGAGGGDWVLVNQFEDNGDNWGGGTPCRPGVDPQERLANASDRPGTESGLPNVSVYFRSDGVGADGLLYKKMSIREIVAPAGGGNALLAAAASGASGGISPAADPASFQFRDLYAFPNPSRRGQPVTIRLQAGLADSVDVSVFDITGRRVSRGGAAGPTLLDDGNGKGPQFTYDYRWDVGGAASAVYIYSVTARRQGQADIGKTGKAAVIK